MELGELFVPHVGWLKHEARDDVARFLREGWFEYKEQAFLWLYLRPGDTIVDCGAHIGLFSVLAGRIAGDSGTVLAIEPNPDTACLLAQNLDANAVRCGRVRQHAILSRDGPATLRIGSQGKTAYSSISDFEDVCGEVEVQGIPLDSLLATEGLHGVIGLVKIDVEGAEVEVLTGAERSVREGRLPVLIIECTEQNLRRFGAGTEVLFESLARAGYDICSLDPETCQLSPHPYHGPIGYENLFAVRRIDEVNARLRGASEPARRTANDLLNRGGAAAALYQRSETAAQAVKDAATAKAAAEEAFQAKGAANWLAAEAGKRAREAEAKIAELLARTGELERVAENCAAEAAESRNRAEASEQVAQSYRERAARSEARAEANARMANENGKLAADNQRAAEQNRAQAVELHRKLNEILTSRPVRWGWKLGLAPKPGWADEVSAALPPPSEVRAVHAPAAAELESEMMRALRHLHEKQFRPQTVLDIGAGKGYWSCLTHGYFPEAEYYLVEPLKENEEELREMCEAHPRMHYIRTAVGNQSGARKMLVSEDLNSSTLLIFPGTDETRQRAIDVTSVDELLASKRIGLPDLVKIDVQGMEMEVLEGSHALFAHAEAFIIEVNLFAFLPGCPRVHEVIRFMEDRGYRLFDLAGSLRRPFENDLGQLDLVMVSERSPMLASNRWN